jgi:hypothetical protein
MDRADTAQRNGDDRAGESCHHVSHRFLQARLLDSERRSPR